MAALRRWALAIAVAAVVVGFFTGIRRYLAFREARWIETDLRERLFAHLQRLHFAFHDRAQTGQLMSRANTDLQQIQAFVVMIPLTISNFVTVLAVTVILLTIDPLLTLLALGSLPFLNVLATALLPAAAPRGDGHPAGVGRAGRGGGGDRRRRARREGLRRRRRAGGAPAGGGRRRLRPVDGGRLGAGHLPARPRAAARTSGSSPRSATAATRCSTGHLSLGELVAFNVYVVMLIWPLRMLGNIIAQGQRAAAAGERVHEILETAPIIVESSDAAIRSRRSDPSGGRGDVTLRRRAVRLRARAADRARRVRPGGAGRAVGGAGRGHRLGQDHRRPPDPALLRRGRRPRARRRRRRAGRAAQRAPQGGRASCSRRRSSSPTASRANIAFADPDAPAEAITRAARLAGADEFIEALPEGYDTLIGERGYSLSGGQRQRIAIARAILADPRVLILDDATSSVDPTKEHEIRDALAEVMRRPHHHRDRPPSGHHRPRRSRGAPGRRARRRRRHPRVPARHQPRVPRGPRRRRAPGRRAPRWVT